MQASERIGGRATSEGTRRFAARFAELPEHFRSPDRLHLSSIGMGTRAGDVSGGDDLAYRGAVARALELGVNVFDSALSYRAQRSERALGAALRRAFAEGRVARDEVFVITKGGYLTVDPDLVHDRMQARSYLYRSYVESKLVDVDRVVNGIHALDPGFVRDQIRRSRENLGLETIDLYCVQEPELQLSAHGPSVFRAQLEALVACLEEAVDAGEIASFGVSTWSGFLIPHTERGHLSLLDLFEVALDVGGADHHFAAIQLPYSLALGDAAASDSQFGPEARSCGVLDALRDTGTAAFAVAPLVQGRAVRGFPAALRRAFPDCRTDAQRALQFARSTPGVTSALVGMRRAEHVEENLTLAKLPPLSEDRIRALF